MEQFPQRGSVPQIGVFHTPRLRNTLTVLPVTCRYALGNKAAARDRSSGAGSARHWPHRQECGTPTNPA